jgi:hypothetical protein
VAIYQRWQQTNTEDKDTCDYTGSKIRTRYRIAEKDELPVDIVLYAEYILGDGPKNYDKFEGKLIFAKDFGQWNIAYNQIYETKTKNGHGSEHAYATGLRYEFSPTWKMGIESSGNYTEDKYYLGPTVSWAAEKFWVNFGALRGLNIVSSTGGSYCPAAAVVHIYVWLQQYRRYRYRHTGAFVICLQMCFLPSVAAAAGLYSRTMAALCR